MQCRVFKYELGGEPTERQVREALDRLPAWRREKALKYRRPLDRFLCAKAYELLQEGLGESPEFEYGANGKPRLKGREDIHFNLSHCSRCVCCAIADAPVGIDVEEIQYDDELARASLSPQELEAVTAGTETQDGNARALEFTRLWTMKESLLKLTGEGIRDNMRHVLEDTQDIVFRTEINRERGYVITSATYRH